jgi:hypothetical protein
MIHNGYVGTKGDCLMDMHELIRQMERAERIWPDDRPWAIQILAGYLHVPPAELLVLFRDINPTLESERDHVLPEDLRLLRAHCERVLEKHSLENLEDKRKEQAKARKLIQSLVPKISEMVAKKEVVRALNTYIYMLGESGEVATPEEKAQWYEEMGRLSLKAKRHPNECARYLKSAVHALSLLEDAEGIKDLLETYEEEFISEEAKKSWSVVHITGQESLEKLVYLM